MSVLNKRLPLHICTRTEINGGLDMCNQTTNKARIGAWCAKTPRFLNFRAQGLQVFTVLLTPLAVCCILPSSKCRSAVAPLVASAFVARLFSEVAKALSPPVESHSCDRDQVAETSFDMLKTTTDLTIECTGPSGSNCTSSRRQNAWSSCTPLVDLSWLLTCLMPIQDRSMTGSSSDCSNRPAAAALQCHTYSSQQLQYSIDRPAYEA